MEGDKYSGLYASWYRDGSLEEETTVLDGQRHGLSKRKTDGDFCYLYFCYGHDITDKIAAMVADTKNISEQEKTIIALELGLLL
jgi:antitoxin component YwqK of YwqJK toxin-antitoxin module